MEGPTNPNHVQIRRPGCPNLTALESRRLATSAKDGGQGQGEAMESIVEAEDKRVIRQRSQA